MKQLEFDDKIATIKEFAKSLYLSYSFRNIKEEIKEAEVAKPDYIDFIYSLYEKETDLRKENGKISRIRNANFPYKKYLDNLKVEDIPKEAASKLGMLKTLEFINNGQNIILAGNPGTGKTHIAISLGIEACNAGFKVLFTAVPNLINRLKEAKSNKTLLNYQNLFVKYDLIILDELGYISFDKEGGELLFELISLRAERKSIIITTNLSFDRWDEVFKDPIMTTAIIDRLTHKSFVLDMSGSSYRLKETKEFLKN